MGAEVKAMEIKGTKTSAIENQISTTKVQNFMADMKNEVKLIHWTSREELIAYAKIVVGATLIMGISIYMLDLFTQTVLNGFSLILRLISG